MAISRLEFGHPPFAVRLSLSSIMSPLSFSSPAARWWSRFLQPSVVLPQTLLRPAAISLTIPGLLSDVWGSVLRAVPKKKTSHMKRRHRQMAGKALRDVKNLNTCPGCGQVKRAHLLCPHCVSDVKQKWGKTQTA